MTAPSTAPAWAIVGIGCRFPGHANTPEQFWSLLSTGTDAISEIPAGRFDLADLYDPDPGRPGKLYTRWGGFADAVDSFDPEFFGISPREAVRIDPQQRMLLEVVWEALEDAGIPADRLAGSRTGVFIGISTHDYGDRQVNPSLRHLLDSHCSTGTALSIAANRVSYVYDLRGPSLAVDTACSSSLTAVHLACRSLAEGECDLAIAGGVNAFLNPETAIGFCKASMLSPDGRCKAFDARANGFVRGEGAGVVVLKPLDRALADHDRIYAVVRGSSVNQDGRTVGMTVPSLDAQEALMREALRAAHVDAGEVQYVEAHGTGTRVGDPIEASAIGRVFGHRGARTPGCLIGSVKTNIGHLEAGAGIAGLIKAALSLDRRSVPPSLHFHEVNPAIPLGDLGLEVVTTLRPWPTTGTRAVAGVNAFGFGGANAHVLLEGASPAAPSTSLLDSAAHLLPISARHPQALRELAGRYRDLLAGESCPPLADICHSAAARRSHHAHRAAVVGDSPEDLVEQLAHLASDAETGPSSRIVRGREPKLAFVFTGMGPQWWAMGRQLLQQERIFREAVEDCDRRFRRISTWPLLDALMADESTSRVHEADQAVAANLAIQVGLVVLLRSWGIVPDAIVGHSAGEMAAAWASGALGLDDALLIAFHRGRLQHRATGSGTMLSAGLSEAEAESIIRPFADRVSLAAVNSSASITLSGDRLALQEIAAELERQQRFNRFVRVEVAYHGPPMDALRDELLASLATLAPRTPALPLVSTVTGTWANGPLDPDYWFGNLRQPVRFADAIGRLIDDDYDLFLEIGPHPALSAFVAEGIAARGRQGTVLPTIRRKEDERRVLLRSIGALYERGRSIEWAGLYPSGRLVALPHYPWQRERLWFESDQTTYRSAGSDTGHPLLGNRLRAVKPTWESDPGQPAFEYLDDHRVQGNPVFPAAGYCELALAAAHNLDPDGIAVVEDVTFKKLLFLATRTELLLQCTLDPATSAFEVHAGAKTEPAWTLHAAGKLRLKAGSRADRRLDLAAVRGACPTAVPVSELYDALAARGLDYRGTFRGLTGLWRGQGEALAQIGSAAEAGADVTGYLVHPALLDSAFQAVLAAIDPGDTDSSGAQRLYLPVAIKRLAWLRHPGTRFWAHVRIREAREDFLDADVSLVDDAGLVALAVEGLRCQSVQDAARGRGEGDEPLYQTVWEPAPLVSPVTLDAAVLSSTEVDPLVRPFAERVARDLGWAERLQDVEPTLERIVAHFARAALRSMGVDAFDALPADPGPLAERLGVAPQHRRLFARLVEVMRDVPVDSPDATPDGERACAEALLERVCATEPTNRLVVDLMRQSGDRLAAILRGEIDSREVLFSPATIDMWARFFTDLPFYAYYNTLVAEVLATAVSRAAAGTPLRVLEIGAGSGGTTASVLPRLEGRVSTYYFTDLSTFFLAKARERFRDQPMVHVAALDIEADPVAQLGREAFDVVLAANVLHATADLKASLGHVRQLLKPGGLLVLLEVSRKMAWMDIIFGITEGWWRFTDVDLRADHALLNGPRWAALLSETGFADPCFLSEPHAGRDPLQSVILATAPVRTGDDLPANRRRRDWLLLSDRTGVGSRLGAVLRARGDRVTTVLAGDHFVGGGADGREMAPDSAADTVRLIGELAAAGVGVDGIVHAWSLDIPAPDGLTADGVMDAQRFGCGSLTALVQAFELQSQALPPLWVLTCGAQPVEAHGAPVTVTQSPIWGLARVLASEQPESVCRLIDLDPAPDDDMIRRLADQLDEDDGEEEIAFRQTVRFVPRLRRASLRGTVQPIQKQLRDPGHHAFHVDIDVPGALETLTLRETALPRPGAGEILIRPYAAGLNFRDVMLALGMLPPMALPGSSRTVLGFECAGVVLACGDGVRTFQPGDEVMAVAIGAFGSQVITRAEMAVRKPAHLSFEQAATIPLAFVTAQYGLVHLAHLCQGERVLIHAATGGVGLAAVQIARRLGAEIFATAGSPEKRAHLQAMGIAHVMDSRSLDFADEVMAATHGEGVDVVLNSLAGDAIPRGLSILRPYGRFIELGKRDIYADSPIGMLPFDRNLSFSSVALERMCVDRPAQVGTMLHEVTDLVEQRSLEPLPHTAYDLEDAEHAVRFLAQARHIGKVVLTTRQPAYRVAPWAERPLCRADGAYVISGGLGGFGLAVARWLIGLGARHIVLLSRSGTPMPENQAAFEALRAMDAEIIVARADVTKEAELLQVLDDLRGRDVPIRGVVHGAMVLDDVLLPQLTQERLHAVLAPKIAGAWNLHRLTERDALDFFIMFSSAAAVLCTKGQGNYAAGNTFLDTLATHRRAMGLPATTVNWGAIAEVGYVSRHDEVAARLQRQGMEAFAASDALHWLEGVVRHGLPSVMAARVDWPRFSGLDPKTSLVKKTRRLSNLTTVAGGGAQGAGAEPSAWLPLLAAAPADEREALLVGHVVERVAKVLGTSARKVDAERPLTEMGVDSLMAVELQTIVDRDFGVNLPLTSLLEGATVRQLSQRVLGGLDLDAGPATAVGSGPASTPETSSAAPVAAPVVAAAPVAAAVVVPVPAPLAVSEAAGTPAIEVPRMVTASPEVAQPAAPAGPAAKAHGRSDYAHLDYGRWSPLQRFSQRVIGAVFRLLAPIEVEGIENIPERGPVLLAVNHLSMLDVAVLLVMLPRRGVCMATDELRRFPWLRWFLDIGNTIYVQRGEADQEAIQSGLAVLRAGGLLGVAPEGRRSRTGGLIKGQYGTALLASEAPAPILPVVAFGQERIVRDLARFRRGRVHVRIGRLMDASQGGRTAARLQHDTDRLMRALAALLPPEYRGVYADAVDPSTSSIGTRQET